MSNNELVEAQRQYCQKLEDVLTEPIFEGIESIYNDAKGTPNTMLAFQKLLRDVPLWNQDVLDREYQRICEASKCRVIDQILRVVFVAHSKILSSIRLNSDSPDLMIDVPTGKVFVHAVYKCVARFAFSNPFLFDDKNNNTERLKNRAQVLKIIEKCIHKTITALIPIENILEQSTNTSFSQPFVNLANEDPEDPDPLEDTDALEEMDDEEIDDDEIDELDEIDEVGPSLPIAPIAPTAPSLPAAPVVPTKVETIDQMIEYPELEEMQFMQDISKKKAVAGRGMKDVPFAVPSGVRGESYKEFSFF